VIRPSRKLNSIFEIAITKSGEVGGDAWWLILWLVAGTEDGFRAIS
jgi:hypothetical protein